MTKNKIFFILILIGLFLTLIYFFTYDKKLYYYGLNSVNYENILPFGLNTYNDVNTSEGFTINNRDDFHIIHNNKNLRFRWWKEELQILKVIRYGYNSNRFVVQILNKDNKKIFIIWYPKKFKVSDNFILDYKIDWVENEKQMDVKSSELTWIQIEGKDKEILKLYRLRNLMILSIFLHSILLAIFFIINLKIKQNNKNL